MWLRENGERRKEKKIDESDEERKTGRDKTDFEE